MEAFVTTPFKRMKDIGHRRATALTKFTDREATCPTTTARRKRVVSACADTPLEETVVAPFEDISFDELVSDDEYVVVDGKDVVKLVDELQRAGLDDIGRSDDIEGLTEDFLALAEERSDEKDGRVVQQEESVSAESEVSSPSASEDSDESAMEYFVEDHLEFMPRWAAEAYQAGEHGSLEDGGSRLDGIGGAKRLHDIVARKKAVETDSSNESASCDGIVDCTVADVSDDYNVPVEFVVDAMLYFGVPVPISSSQSIRDCMTTEEIGKLLTLITSFDSQDLGDRYSDRTITELAEDYDFEVDKIIEVCEKEGLYLCREAQTRLSTVREDRVLDIILKGAALGQSYPPLLEGLVPETREK